MKTTRIIICICFLQMLLCSCRKEQISYEQDTRQMGNITVTTTDALTKCDNNENETIIENRPFVTGNGDTIYVSVYLADMPDIDCEQTKGTPINNDRFGKYEGYDEFVTDVYDISSWDKYTSSYGGTTRRMSRVSVTCDESSWTFDNKYYWPENDSDLWFLAFAPSGQITNDYLYYYSTEKARQNGYGWNTSTQSWKARYYNVKETEFDGKLDAEKTVDLLIACNKQNASTDNGKVSIAFKHAMVGVQFLKGDIAGGIKSVSLHNFYQGADVCVNNDNITWNNYRNPNMTYTQIYDFNCDGKADLAPLDPTKELRGTFMMIPQTVRNDAYFEIETSNSLHPEVLKCADFIGTDGLSDNWQQYMGKIIRFRISSTKANSVSVAIRDTVDNKTKTKKDIVIKNDGLSDIFIRLEIVGNWLNADNKVLASWSETKPYGVFDNGFPSNLSTNWKKGDDGFYYYKKYLEPGKTVSDNLFNTFTNTGKPNDSEGTWKEGGTDMEIKKFEMAILVQAVIAESSKSNAIKAWDPENKWLSAWIGTPQSDK